MVQDYTISLKADAYTSAEHQQYLPPSTMKAIRCSQSPFKHGKNRQELLDDVKAKVNSRNAAELLAAEQVL
jgi:hypothetical protein